MTKEESIDNIEQAHIAERSSEVNEILGTPPNLLITWGMTVIFIILLILIISSSLISYNEIVNARINITTDTPPTYIKAKTTGKLMNLFVQENQKVRKGKLLAEIESSAEINDVLFLKRKLSKFEPQLLELDSLTKNFPLDLQLGLIQSSYSEFLSNYQRYILLTSLKPSHNTLVTTEKQILEQQALLKNRERQLKLFKQELNLSQQNFKRQKQLLAKGVISQTEFEKASRDLLEDEQKVENFEINILNTRISIASLRDDKVQTNISRKQMNFKYQQDLFNSVQQLQYKIHDWEATYLLKSPIEGKISLFNIRNKYHNINVGDIVMTIIPPGKDEIIGYMTIPILNSGKVKLNQDVIIKLDNYPYQQWGSLKGKVIEISAVPKKGENLYYLKIKINSLKTSSEKLLGFKQEMQGNAEIITEKLSVMERIFYQFKSFF